MMDVLAEASLAASAHEEEAAEILKMLCTHRETPEPEAASDDAEATGTAGSADGDCEDATRPWEREEDDQLRRLALAKVGAAGGAKRGAAGKAPPHLEMRAWREISEHFDDRSALQCMQRFEKVLSPDNIKGPWCPNEDAQLVELVKQYGGKHWARIASMLPGRTGKQCRERWCNNLDPSLKKGAWTPEEDMIILEMHGKLGTRWAEIAKCLPGRSDNSVKNRWYSTCSRILRQQQEAAAAEAAGAPRPAREFKPDYSEYQQQQQQQQQQQRQPQQAEEAQPRPEMPRPHAQPHAGVKQPGQQQIGEHHAGSRGAESVLSRAFEVVRTPSTHASSDDGSEQGAPAGRGPLAAVAAEGGPLGEMTISEEKYPHPHPHPSVLGEEPPSLLNFSPAARREGPTARRTRHSPKEEVGGLAAGFVKPVPSSRDLRHDLFPAGSPSARHKRKSPASSSSLASPMPKVAARAGERDAEIGRDRAEIVGGAVEARRPCPNPNDKAPSHGDHLGQQSRTISDAPPFHMGVSMPPSWPRLSVDLPSGKDAAELEVVGDGARSAEIH